MESGGGSVAVVAGLAEAGAGDDGGRAVPGASNIASRELRGWGRSLIGGGRERSGDERRGEAGDEPQARQSRGSGEAALVRAAQRGSEAAIEELFARHWSGAFRTALLVTGDRTAAEDIAQEAFLAALRALPRFDVRRPLGPWLHRIAVNRAIDWSRARALRNEVGAAAAPDAPARAGAGDPRLGEVVTAALARLAPEQRAVIVLRYLLDLTPGEIAETLDLPRGTVNSRLRRGLDALGQVLEDEPS
jgi:RNA polymerase sigma-70 factor (ECF subfamily)